MTKITPQPNKELTAIDLIVLESLLNFATNAFQKYLKGRREHNEDLSELNYQKEIHNEMMDLVVYMALKNYYENKD